MLSRGREICREPGTKSDGPEDVGRRERISPCAGRWGAWRGYLESSLWPCEESWLPATCSTLVKCEKCAGLREERRSSDERWKRRQKVLG